MTRGARIAMVAVVAGVLAVGVGLVRWRTTREWPVPIEREWADLVDGTAGHPVCVYTDARLDTALEVLDPESATIGDGTLDALDHLLAWALRFEGVRGADPADARALVRLASTAVDTGDPPLVAAAMRLGWALRRCGRLALATAGFDIADHAVRTAPHLALGVHPRYLPADANVLAALKAEASMAETSPERAFWFDRLRRFPSVRAHVLERFRDPAAPPGVEIAQRVERAVVAMVATVEAYDTAVARAPPGGYPSIPRPPSVRESASDWIARQPTP